jgi:hypothetical protein
VLEPADGEIVVVLTAPGRVEAGGQGRFALRGDVAAASAAGAVDGRDVAPTLLYALGLPVSRALPGTAATGLLSRSFVDRYPIRFVAEYGTPNQPAARRGGEPLEQDMIDRLRSLGYVK